MALVLKDRVKETSTTAGTGTITLDGAVAGFQSFSAVGNANTTYYAIVDPTTGDWEVGLGTYTASGTTLSRDTVLSSSNSGSLVSFAANPKDVFVTYPSEKSVYEDASNVVNATLFGAITATSAALTTGTVSTTPASNTDIANKQYVDGLVTQGISYHEPVYVESPNTTGNLNATYNNGASGVGATLTNAGTQVALTVDGILMTVGKRVLIYNQTNATQNGVYTVTTVGTGSTNWVLTRAADANTYGIRDPNALGYNDAFFVTNGDTGVGETYVCTTTGIITFGTTNITFAQISSAQVYTAGTGLNLSPATTFNISNTGVSASTYGSASAVPVFAVNAQGQLTSVTNTTIAINGSQVSGNISGSAGSVANALTFGTYLTGGTYNGSAAVTATVDATSANTASKVVARDSSGNFSAGTITATLNGTATSTTTATNLAGGAANRIAYQSGAGTTTFATAPSASNQVLNWNGSAFTWSAGTISGVALGSNLNSLTAGTYLSGTAYNGSAAQTWSVNATSANTASTVVARDGSGNFSAGTITASLSGNATTATSATSASTSTTQGKTDASTNIATTAFSKWMFATSTTGGTLDWNNSSNTIPGVGTTLLLGSATNGPGGSNYYHPFNIEYSGISGTGNVTQMAIAYGSPANELYMRGSYSGGWSSWVRFLNSNNYNSYSPTLTGGGASGTWSINITGSAGSASSVAWGNVTSKPSNIMYYAGFTLDANTMPTNSTGFTYSVNAPATGPIARFSTDGSYDLWLNANYSNGNNLFFRTRNGDAGTFNSWRTLPSYGVNASASELYASSFYYTYDTAYGVIGSNGYFDTVNSGYAGDQLELNYVRGTYVSISHDSMRAPLFYDYNNTAYYVDPASTSNVLSIYAEDSLVRIQKVHSEGGEIRFLNTAQTTGGWIQGWDSGLRTVDHNWTITTWAIDNAGNSIATASHRAPIFYDSNDTAYYVDPNSGSRLANIFAGNVASSNDGGWNARINLVGSQHARLDVVSNSDGIITTMYSHTGQGVGKVGTYSNHPLALMAQGANDGGYVYNGSLRSPIFYDSNNTSYYCDPASTTQLNYVYTSNNIRGGNGVTAANASISSGYGGFGGTPSNGYLITTNISYGVFNMPTVIVEGYAYGNGQTIHIEIVWYSYAGGFINCSYTNLGAWDPGTVRIGTNGSDKICIHFSNNIYFGRMNVRAVYDQGPDYLLNWSVQQDVSYSVLSRVTTVGTQQIRAGVNTSDNCYAPILYDVNNTAYYVDPHQTSRMGTINADSLYSYGNVTAYSDERLKTDWEVLPEDFVEKLAKVKSGTYTRIDSGERQVGVGAQSLQVILEEAVSNSQEYLGVNYGNAALVSAVELAKYVTALEERIQQLEARL